MRTIAVGQSTSTSTPNVGCSLKFDNTLACWGDNSHGQATPPSGTFTHVAVGDEHVCATRSTDGVVQYWGDNTYGQLNASASPTVDVNSGLYAGWGNTCSTVGGITTCWGKNNAGQLYSGIGGFSQIALGDGRGWYINSDGTVECHGYPGCPDYYLITEASQGLYYSCFIRQLDGVISCINWAGTEANAPGGDGYDHLSVGLLRTCAISGGYLSCTGLNTSGQASPPYGTYTQVSVGDAYSCAVNSANDEVCWGEIVR